VSFALGFLLLFLIDWSGLGDWGSLVGERERVERLMPNNYDGGLAVLQYYFLRDRSRSALIKGYSILLPQFQIRNQ
jgi:hypothetical protein